MPFQVKNKPNPKCPRCKGSLLKNRSAIECINCGYEVQEQTVTREESLQFQEGKGKVWGR